MKQNIINSDDVFTDCYAVAKELINESQSYK
jgi:hypothetical protein